MIILPNLTTSLIHFSLKVWENVLFDLGAEGLNSLALWVDSLDRWELFRPHEERLVEFLERADKKHSKIKLFCFTFRVTCYLRGVKEWIFINYYWTFIQRIYHSERCSLQLDSVKCRTTSLCVQNKLFKYTLCSSFHSICEWSWVLRRVVDRGSERSYVECSAPPIP